MPSETAPCLVCLFSNPVTMLSVSFTIRAFRAEVMFQILPAFQWHALTIHFAPLPYQTYKNTVQIKDKGMYCPLPLLLTILSSFIPDIVSSLQTTTYFISHLSKETWVYTQNVHKESCKKNGFRARKQYQKSKCFFLLDYQPCHLDKTGGNILHSYVLFLHT